MNDNKDYQIQLDSIRFIAIVMVMVAHWLQWQMSNVIITNFPFVHGVILFFVLSGFLITKILISNRNKYESNNLNKLQLVKQFYIRRFLRIFPIYYLTIFFLLFLHYQNTSEIFPWLISYSSNIYQSIHNVYVGNFNHFWSLGVEEQFYLFWPWLMIFIPNKYLEKTIIITIVISLLTKLFIFLFIHKWMAGAYFTISCMHALGLGSLLAIWAIKKKRIIDIMQNNILISVVTVVYLIILYISVVFHINWYKEILDEFLFAIVSGFIIIKAFNNGFTLFSSYLLENKAFVYFGKISYGMYVYHVFMPDLFYYITPAIGLSSTNKYTSFILFFILTFIVSHISWKIIEYPINSLKSRFSYIKKV